MKTFRPVAAKRSSSARASGKFDATRSATTPTFAPGMRASARIFPLGLLPEAKKVRWLDMTIVPYCWPLLRNLQPVMARAADRDAPTRPLGVAVGPPPATGVADD